MACRRRPEASCPPAARPFQHNFAIFPDYFIFWLLYRAEYFERNSIWPWKLKEDSLREIRCWSAQAGWSPAGSSVGWMTSAFRSTKVPILNTPSPRVEMRHSHTILVCPGAFMSARLDGRVLHRLSLDDLQWLHINLTLHVLSIKAGIYVSLSLSSKFFF